jgi:hypothetical protein
MRNAELGALRNGRAAATAPLVLNARWPRP